MSVDFLWNLGHKNMRSLKRVYATVAFKTPAEARQKRLHFLENMASVDEKQLILDKNRVKWQK